MKKYITLVWCLSIGLAYGQKDAVFQNVTSIVNETQRIVSVKKGQAIDTAYFRSLFIPSAHFTVVGEENGKMLHETMSLDAFLETLTDDYYTNGYNEQPLGQVVEQYKGVAHAMQSFYGEDSEGESGWGVGSYQLIYSEGRWWITSMVWTMSSDGKDIPKKYLRVD